MRLLSSVLIVGIALSGACAHAVKIKTLYPILVDPGSTSSGFGLNNKTYVTASDASGPLLVGPHGVTVRLDAVAGSLGETPMVVNSFNQVGGVAVYLQGGVLTEHATITGKKGVGVTDLGALPQGTITLTYGMNDSGQLVGLGNTPLVPGGYHGFVTSANGKSLRDLGTLNGDPSLAVFAYAINATGEVAGASQTGPGRNTPYHAVLTLPKAGAMRDIHTLATAFETIGRGVNASGMVVGELYQSAGGIQHAFITGAEGAGMRDIGTLGGKATAFGINSDGNVVGESEVTDGTTHAFITDNNGKNLRDLNDVAAGTHPLFIHAYTINDKGQVLAIGSDDQTYLLCVKQGCF